MPWPGHVAVVRSLAGALSAWVMPAAAISPATVDQVVCGANVVVEATVTAARAICVKTDDSTRCSGPENGLLLDLQIVRMLARKDATATTASSARVVVGASITNVQVNGIEQFSHSRDFGRILPFVEATRYSGVPERRGIEAATTSADAVRFANSTLKGSTSIFALPSRRSSSDGWFAMMWQLDREGELLDLLEHTDWPGCPAVVGKGR